MKCLIINGSPSKSYTWNNILTESFTGKLAKEVQDTMSQLGKVDFEEIRLIDAGLPYCRGCYNCFFKGENSCPHAKYVQPIMEKIREADCVILTSPVYALNVSGLIKNFFDLTAYNYHRPAFFDKKALVISSTAGGAAKKICKYMRDTLKHWGFNRVYTLPVVRMGAYELDEKLKRRCRAAAVKFYKDVASGKLHPPTFKRLLYYQLWRNLSKGNADSADYRYWRDSGLVRHAFSPKIRIGFIKRAFAGMINGLLKKVSK
jgi:multimeric flavodoxin WrbA